MKSKIMIGMAALALAASLTACGDRIKYGEAAVEVREVGTGAGVQEREITTGKYWAPPFSYRYIVKFPITQQTFSWQGGEGNAPCLKFINADRVNTDACLSANIQINPDQADNLVRKYRGSISRNDQDGYGLNDIVYGPFQRELQSTLNFAGTKYTAEQLYSDGGKALSAEVYTAIREKFAKDGIIVQDLMWTQPPRLPSNIVESLQGALRAQAEARKKGAELEATIAEGKKTVAQAQADAEARRLTAESIRSSPEILKLEELKVHRGICPLNAEVCVVGSDAATLINR